MMISFFCSDSQADQKSVAMNQIELDLYRTLPTHKNYKADGEWVRDIMQYLCWT